MTKKNYYFYYFTSIKNNKQNSFATEKLHNFKKSNVKSLPLHSFNDLNLIFVVQSLKHILKMTFNLFCVDRQKLLNNGVSLFSK